MRLIHTKTFEIRMFNESNRPPYAILSHAWETDEVEFADMQDLSRAKKRKGWAKLESFCRTAASKKYEWGWDDTCCIDKSSSLEHSEAINSMYAWYREAEICFAYLADVHDLASEDPESDNSSFRKSRWFQRGWTLQELIAPKNMWLMSKSWNRIGTRLSLAEVIEEITHVDRGILTGKRLPFSMSVARRMSWAAARETTLIEDRAYSLMGIFGVNMPTIYGEGEKAFIRLQLEIIRQSPDHSIFAWGAILSYAVYKDNAPTLIEDSGWLNDFRGLLAPSPRVFANSGRIEAITVEQLAGYTGKMIDVPEFDFTNYGIRIYLPLYYDVDRKKRLALLACRDTQSGHLIALLVSPRSGSNNRYYVGMDAQNRPIPKGATNWYAYFRTFRIPVHNSPNTPNKVLQTAEVTRMYLHSYNPDPQHSEALGIESGRVVVHDLRTKNRQLPVRYAFEIAGSLVKALATVGLYTKQPYREKGKPQGGRAPPQCWTDRPHVGIVLQLDHPGAPVPVSQSPSSIRANLFGSPSRSSTMSSERTLVAASSYHAVIVFRDPSPSLCSPGFALIIGLSGEGALPVWATVLLKDYQEDSLSKLVDWDSAKDDADIANAAWELLQLYNRIPAEEFMMNGAGWVDGVRTFGGDGNMVRVTLRALEAENQVSGDTMTYAVGLEVDFGDKRLWASNAEARDRDLSSLSRRGSA